MKFMTGMLFGIALALGLPAGATVVQPLPEPSLFHPRGTIGPLVLPAVCKQVRTVHAEQHRVTRIDEVREVLIVRLHCSKGDRRRTVTAYGPWFYTGQ